MSDDQGPAVSRRSLREKRRAGEAASRNERSSADGVEHNPSSPEDPAAPQHAPIAEPTDATAARVARANRSRRAADAPVDAVPERTSLQRARDREALRTRRRLETGTASEAAPGASPGPVTRRQLRLQSLAVAKAESAQENSAEANDDGMSVEAALAARRELMGLTPGTDEDADESAPDDTGLMNLERLAKQREHAARAAVINRRVAERRRLEQANSQRLQQVRSDPFTGSMTQLRDQQAEKDLANTGVRGPQTSGFRLELAAKPPVGPTEPEVGAAVRPDAIPVQAVTAQGLDPLDYMTAGVRRANRLALVVLGSLVVGAATLVTGLILMMNSR
ncbi:hypothetical protein [Arthrobacter sp. KK5.5]|uniref:hypothetical protein n=1 Tax=Arthrobacter sp. KK5.5 TaxID=3373084 RepID=UPI003EE6051D